MCSCIIFKYFIENFYINIRKGNWSLIFFVGSLCGWGINVIVVSYNELGNVLSFPDFPQLRFSLLILFLLSSLELFYSFTSIVFPLIS